MISIPKVLITGLPGCGKTTLVKKMLSKWNENAGGFVTEEIRGEHGRTGFKVRTLDGDECLLAEKRSLAKSRVNIDEYPRVGSYIVHLDAVEKYAIPSIEIATQNGTLVVIDEIGKMELLHPQFFSAVDKAIDSSCPVLATIVLNSHPVADRLKAKPEVCLVQFEGREPEHRLKAQQEVERLLGIS